MPTNDSPKPSVTAPPSGDKKKRTILLVAGVLIYSAFVYGSGMEGEIRKAKSVNEQRKVAEQDYRDAQRKLRLRIAAVEQLEARRRLDLALGELDRRNYGSAQDDISVAVKLLTSAQAANSTNPNLSPSLNALKSTNLAVTTNMSAQRDALVAVAAQLDSAFSAYTPGFIETSLQDDQSHPIHPPTANDVPNPADTGKGSDLAGGEDHPK